MNPLAKLIAVLGSTFTALLAIIALYFAGKRSGKKELENEIIKKELEGALDDKKLQEDIANDSDSEHAERMRKAFHRD
jgi:phage terminase large subunit-like protein